MLRAKTGSRRRPSGGGPGTYTLRGGGVGRVRRKPSSLEIHSSAGSAIGYSFASNTLRSVVSTNGSASHWSIARPAVAIRFIALAATDRWKYCQVTSSIMSQAFSAPNWALTSGLSRIRKASASAWLVSMRITLAYP